MKLLSRIAQASFLPHQLQHRVINDWLRRQFSSATDSSDLSFLRGRFLAIQIDDIEFDLTLTLGKSGLVMINGDVEKDATISGCLESFLLLAEQEVDPDTLFFQRKLRVEGDTEFALEVKNLLYRVEWLPESKRLAHSIHAMQRAFNKLPSFPSLPSKKH